MSLMLVASYLAYLLVQKNSILKAKDMLVLSGAYNTNLAPPPRWVDELPKVRCQSSVSLEQISSSGRSSCSE